MGYHCQAAHLSGDFSTTEAVKDGKHICKGGAMLRISEGAHHGIHQVHVQTITAAKTKSAKQNLEFNWMQLHYPSNIRVLCPQCIWSTWPLAQCIYGNSNNRGY